MSYMITGRFSGGMVSTTARAAAIGGVRSTSNVLAGCVFDLPVKGTHAHSWVMAFDDELSAFRAYAECFPDHCVLLVDTYDTLQGVRHAVKDPWAEQVVPGFVPDLE